MKLSIGNYNTLEIIKETPQGLYLASSEGEILLPNKFIPENYTLGDQLTVFVYTDSEDRLVATTQTPKVKVGEFASLLVKDITRFGAFLDWGLDKDLLLPYKEQPYQVKTGDHIVVRACLDFKTQRVIAVAKIESFLEKDTHHLEEGKEVSLLVYNRTPMGYKAVVDQKYGGMIYQNEVFNPIQVGTSMTGYVKKIREDGKVDISLQQEGYAGIQDAKAQIMQQLREEGFLPYHDHSSPEDIKEKFHMSKKNFKKAIGGLLKEGKVDIKEDGLYLR